MTDRIILEYKKTPDMEMWFYNKNGRAILHRENDLPAVTYANGAICYHIHGLRHRLNGPAWIDKDGTERWYFEDRPHRIGGPAVTYPSGTLEFWAKGMPHNDSGPSYICPWATGDHKKIEWRWWKLLHNMNGPAIEYANGTYEFRVLGALHNYNGPAVVRNGIQIYALHGVELHEAIFLKLMADNDPVKASARIYNREWIVRRHIIRVLNLLGAQKVVKNLKLVGALIG